MGMVVEEMIGNDLNAIRDLLVKTIISTGKIEIKDEIMCETGASLNLIPNFLSVYITLDDITIFYADEHDEFWKAPYNTEKEWIKAASKHIIELATSTIIIDYFYDKKTEKLLRYKIWIENKKRNYKKLLKRVSITANPLAIFKPKTVVEKILNSAE